MQFYLIIALLFAAAVSVFAIQNSGTVQINFLFWEVEQISQVLVILISAGTGALIAILAGTGKQFRLRRQVKQLTQENKRLQQELQDLEQQQEESSRDTRAEPGDTPGESNERSPE